MKRLDLSPLLEPVLKLQAAATKKSEDILEALVASMEAEPAALTG